MLSRGANVLLLYYMGMDGIPSSGGQGMGERLKGFPAMQRVATRGQTLINFWCVLPTLTIREEHNNTLYWLDRPSQPASSWVGVVILSSTCRTVLVDDDLLKRPRYNYY